MCVAPFGNTLTDGMTDDLGLLFRLAGARRDGGALDDWSAYFEPAGLILQIPERLAYWCTPLNALTFARTGGDGTHYSLVRVPGIDPAQRPVVMTVPMSDDPNVIVGENLRDFLALGCRFGYFGLEGLVHQRAQTIAELARARYAEGAREQQLRLLQILETAFDLKPWPKPTTHLAELKLRYFSALDIPARS